MKIGLLIVLLLAAAHFAPPGQTELTITAVNKLKFARPNETIELTLKDLAPLAEKDLTKLHVRDSSARSCWPNPWTSITTIIENSIY